MPLSNRCLVAKIGEIDHFQYGCLYILYLFKRTPLILSLLESHSHWWLRHIHERVTINILVQNTQISQTYKGMIWKTAQQKLNRHFRTWVKAMKDVTDCASTFTFPFVNFVFAKGFESSQAVPGDPFTDRGSSAVTRRGEDTISQIVCIACIPHICFYTTPR